MSVVTHRMSNKDRIAVIMDFFGVSHEAATFMYYRKLRGYPFKKRNDPKFLEWNLCIQNAFIKADSCLEVDWEKIKFGSEDRYLYQHGISIKDQPSTEVLKLERNVCGKNDASEKNVSENDGWHTVKDIRKINHRQIKVLQTMGFVSRISRKEHYAHTTEDEDQPDK